MKDEEQNFWDFLSTDEAAFSESIMDELAQENWARPLLQEIDINGGLTRANMSRFFELRFGHALHQAGIVPAYEVPGEGDSTLDFGFNASGQEWRVEIMRLEETAAVQRATNTGPDKDGVTWSNRILSSNANDPRESTEGETLKAVERICQKLERNGRPHKFPVPSDALHAVLVDFRTFLNGGDDYDRIHVGLEGEYVPEPMARMYLNYRLISGVFSLGTTLHGAAEARERLHFWGFVSEKEYKPGAFAAATQFIANPHLFQSTEDVHAAIKSWPLHPAVVLNGGK